MNKIPQVAVVGAGLVGIRHVAAIQQLGNVNLAAIVDTTDSARQIATNNKVPFYESMEALFSTESPDGVILSTPTILHVEQGLQCIDNDCPILVEKPIATCAADASQLVEVAANKNIPILVGHHRRHNPLIQKARSLLDDAVIGDLRSAQGTCWFYKPDDYFDIAPWRKKIGAGPISVNLVHDIDLMRYLIGDVVRVQAAATKSIRGYENEDVAAAVLTFANGVIGTITVSDSVVSPWSWESTAGENPRYAHTNQSCLLIGGSEGSLSIPDLTIWSHQGERSWWSPLSAMSVPQDRSDPLINQLSHFADVIKGKVTPVVSGLEGMKTLQVIEAMQTAAKTGEPIEVVSV